MDNRWIEISAFGPIGTRDEAIEALIEAGSPGVLEGPSNRKAGRQKAESGGPIGSNGGSDDGLRAYLHGGEKPAIEEKLKGLEERLKALKWAMSLSEYKDEDWTKKWREAIHPVEVTEAENGRKLIIKASWHTVRSRPDDIVIEIDPSMAFGTGSHPSTRMCLRAIAYITGTGDGNGSYGRIRSLLDIGSGTGILSIAGKLLNVEKVVGLDIEADSVKIARKNARLNKVKCSFKEVELNDPLKEIKTPFDLVVANIISGELIRIAPRIERCVLPDAFLVLSGILSSEAEEVYRTYKSLGFTAYMRYAESAIDQGGGDWVTLVLRKNT